MLLKLFDFFNSCRSCWTELTPFWKCALLSWEWGCRSCSRRWWRAGKVSECTWIRGRKSCGQLRTATCSSTRYARHPVHSTLTFVKLLISWKIQKNITKYGWNYFLILLYCFVLQAQDYSLWCSQVLSGMKAEESIRDVATCDLQLFQHQQLWAEIVAREETYAQAESMGQDQLELDTSNAKEVRNSHLSNLNYNTNCLLIWHKYKF